MHIGIEENIRSRMRGGESDQKRAVRGESVSNDYSGEAVHSVHCDPSVPISCLQCATGGESFDLCGVADAESGKTAKVQNANFLKHIRIFEKCSRYSMQNQSDFILSDKPQYEVDILLAIPCGKGGDNR